MAQSSELSGGAGFTFEDRVVAFYLTALLAEAYAPGIDNRTVVRVSVQQRSLGEPLDDIIVDFEDATKELARLSLQAKSSLTISAAKTNEDFRSIIRDSWITFKKRDFRINLDRYGAAVGKIASNKEKALKDLCESARESRTASHFNARFAKDGNASAEIKALKDIIVALLQEVKGTPCTSEEVHEFLVHFVLIRFDFLHEGATDPSVAINCIRDCLAPADVSEAPLVWSHILQLARIAAGKSGQFDRARLVSSISPVARLRGAISFQHDLDRLTELAKNSADSISDDIRGTKLDRALLFKELEKKRNTELTSARIVQICGLPGSGKSAVMKRAVQRALERGPVLFLKADQLEGASWISHATSQGLSSTSLESLLVEVEAAGTPTLFIDAIDRIKKEHEPIILDVIRTIVKSPLLNNWRLTVSLRNTGIEVLRNWLGEFLDALKVETLNVGLLSNEEAKILAKAKPHLKLLLFGSDQVREIVRRLFFAKMLDQNYMVDPRTLPSPPQSEVDLIEHWWQRGGYNETRQSAIERRRVLLDLARVAARQLSQPIYLGNLNPNSIAHINDLISDGILQEVRPGISVRFTHDIFFEWAFFYTLADRGLKWIDEIKICGEPPAVARVVELLSQWEYVQGENWCAPLAQIGISGLRSQWLRAWLFGPLGTAKFESDENQFATAVFADDFRLLKKTLVWFQAEKTFPNPNILASTLPDDQRQRFADFLSWPSDLALWRRLIHFILRHISEIPPRLYPKILTIFEVWQNPPSEIHNPTSHALLQQCASWLAFIDAIPIVGQPDENPKYWHRVPNLDDFQKSLAMLLLRSTRTEPTFAADYLQRITNAKRIREDVFSDILAFSPLLAQSLPQPLVELSLAFLRTELPDEQVAREERERDNAFEWRKAVLAKSKAERTRQEQIALSSSFSLRTVGDFDWCDWQRLSIHHSSFRNLWPPSPLREPFYSLFQSSPEEALRLLRELCKHAMTAWRQLHRHSRNRPGTPIPFELTFPWGTQKFWGTDREYLWYRSTWAPEVIGCGFMALEECCFAELSRGRPVDEVIQQIVEGNECIAVLGIASMLALHTQTVSETTLPLFTSQRLLTADRNRMVQNCTFPTANLMGFMHRADEPHREAIKAANARMVRKLDLSWMVPKFIFAAEPICNRAREAILNFKNNLPYQYEEHRNNLEVREYLTVQALKYAELADPQNYQGHPYPTKEDPDRVVIVHTSPSAAKPENVARTEEISKQLRQANLWEWAFKFFEEGTPSDTYTVEGAIALAKEADATEFFEYTNDENDEKLLGKRRGAVAATAAIVLNFREGRSQEDLGWARGFLTRAICLLERPNLSPVSILPWHHGIYVARGLAADLREGTAVPGATHDLLALIAHPLEVVSLTAIEESCKLWSKDSKLTWAALILAFSLCHVSPLPRDQLHQHSETLCLPSETQAAVEAALAFYEQGSGWPSLSLPSPAWIEVKPANGRRGRQSYEGYDMDDVVNMAQVWGEPDTFWHSGYAAKILERVPFDEILSSSARHALLDFLASALDWTNQKNAPPWVKQGRRNRPADRLFEWTKALGSTLGRVAGLLPLRDFQTRFLHPILALEGDNCWDLLSPFASTYICVYVYDAPIMPPDAVATLSLCLERFLQDSAFKRDAYRGGEFSGYHQPELARTLMFVSVERAGLATRYANGDWSGINYILPLIDQFVRAGGWAASVMDPFLTLCERARANYPAETFADQVLAVIGNGSDNLKGWNRMSIPARIAELVHHFAHRNTPMGPTLAQKFLQILDTLVDMGDRRSAALQLSEAFREVRFSDPLQKP